jgi:hypothetical protein
MDFLFEFLNIHVNEKGTTCHDYMISMVLNDKTYMFNFDCLFLSSDTPFDSFDCDVI